MACRQLNHSSDSGWALYVLKHTKLYPALESLLRLLPPLGRLSLYISDPGSSSSFMDQKKISFPLYLP